MVYVLDKPSRIINIAIAMKTLCKTAKPIKQTPTKIKKSKFVVPFVLLA